MTQLMGHQFNFLTCIVFVHRKGEADEFYA